MTAVMGYEIRGQDHTAIVLLRLFDEARLDLDTPIADSLRLDPIVRRRISSGTKIGHLLSHTSGLFSDLEVREEAAHCGAVGELLQSLRQSYSPGSIFSYSHTPHVLLGIIIEAVSGRPWGENVRKLLVDELGGQFSSNPNKSVPTPHIWHGPEKLASPWDGSFPRNQLPVIGAATGNLSFTDSKTLCRLGCALLKQTELPTSRAILSEPSKDLLRQADWRPVWGGSPFFGLGLKMFVEGCYGHHGSSRGYNTFLLIHPARNQILSIAANADSGLLANKLMVAVTSKHYDLMVSAPAVVVFRFGDSERTSGSM